MTLRLDRVRVDVSLLWLLCLATWSTPSFAEGKYPDWSGQWVRAYPGPARYDPDKRPGAGQEAPLKDEYRLLHEQSLKDREAGGQGLDTTYRCLPLGVPRQMTGVSPMEFVIAPKVTYVTFERMTAQTCRIFTDGRRFPVTGEPFFVGHSVGKWLDTDGDGRFDTLEVETRNLHGPHTFDDTGIPFHEDDEAVVTERFYLDRFDPSVLHNDITTTDNALVRPWTGHQRYRRQAKEVWKEDNCTADLGHVAIGSENYLVSDDGYIMPSRKDQVPPDLRYFKKSE